MNDALYIAATGMQVQQKHVDTISNNIANINTPGFKKGKVSFEDMVYRDLAGVSPAEAATGRMFQGSGVAMSSIVKAFSAGELKPTGNLADIAIRGDAFLQVEGEDGMPAFARGGNLSVDRDGFLTIAGGRLLRPAIRAGADVAEIRVEADGRVMVRGANQREAVEAGRLELVRFTDPSGLEPLSGGAYKASAQSGEPLAVVAGEDSSVAQGYSEASNVNLVEEMVELMVAQRAYESNVKVIQASDEMLAMSNSLRK